jgi:hypothetical protein
MSGAAWAVTLAGLILIVAVNLYFLGPRRPGPR